MSHAEQDYPPQSGAADPGQSADPEQAARVSESMLGLARVLDSIRKQEPASRRDKPSSPSDFNTRSEDPFAA
jgi:hypothetical protein